MTLSTTNESEVPTIKANLKSCGRPENDIESNSDIVNCELNLKNKNASLSKALNVYEVVSYL